MVLGTGRSKAEIRQERNIADYIEIAEMNLARLQNL